MLFPFDPWIVGGLCLGLALLYVWGSRVRRFRLAEIQELRLQVERMSKDVRDYEAEINRRQTSESARISAVSHELRTPLTCLLGYTQLMIDSEYPRERQLGYLTIILRETQSLDSLLTDLLDRSREPADSLKLRPGRIEDVLRETFDLFRNQPGPHQFVLELGRPLPEVHFDAPRIRQVLSNLMSNAVKYSPRGGTIRLSACVSGAYVVACVQDEGMGIPVEAIPKLFTRFFRVDGKNSKIRGTGLGLALVQECVKAHGGDTWVESKPGSGSSFYFSLPAIRRQETRTSHLDRKEPISL